MYFKPSQGISDIKREKHSVEGGDGWGDDLDTHDTITELTSDDAGGTRDKSY